MLTKCYTEKLRRQSVKKETDKNKSEDSLQGNWLLPSIKIYGQGRKFLLVIYCDPINNHSFWMGLIYIAMIYSKNSFVQIHYLPLYFKTYPWMPRKAN